MFYATATIIFSLITEYYPYVLYSILSKNLQFSLIIDEILRICFNGFNINTSREQT